MITDTTEIFVPRYRHLNELWKRHERAHWNIDEADMRTDMEQWKNGKISDEEKSFIKMILRMFTQADTNVCGSYVSRLLPVFSNADARTMLLSFAARETTHMFGYKMLNDTLGYDSESFLREFLNFKEMKDKHDFMIEATPFVTPEDIAIYLARQVLMEGVNLFGPFSQLLSFSREGKLPGMVSINQWSITDETLHIEGLTNLFQIYLEEHPYVINDKFKATIYETYTKVVAIEDSSIDLAYSAGNTSTSKPDEVKAYIRYVGDYRMQQLGLKPQYGIEECPMPWVEEVTGNTFGNFFETTVVEYTKSPLIGDWVY